MIKHPHLLFYGRQLLLAAVAVMLLAICAQAQTKYATQQANVKVLGTSTLHDWNMASDKGVCEATFTVQGDQLKSLDALTFSVPVKTLHSEHNGLDKNAYNALSADKHDKIAFALTAATVPTKQADGYNLACKGNLTVAGVTKPITLEANCKLNADNTLACKGFYLMKMTTHNVQPPKLMMGTIKTGDDIHIDFALTLKP
jgi:polyisoprenoid-binding protein YceI